MSYVNARFFLNIRKSCIKVAQDGSWMDVPSIAAGARAAIHLRFESDYFDPYEIVVDDQIEADVIGKVITIDLTGQRFSLLQGCQYQEIAENDATFVLPKLNFMCNDGISFGSIVAHWYDYPWSVWYRRIDWPTSTYQGTKISGDERIPLAWQSATAARCNAVGGQAGCTPSIRVGYDHSYEISANSFVGAFDVPTSANLNHGGSLGTRRQKTTDARFSTTTYNSAYRIYASVQLYWNTDKGDEFLQTERFCISCNGSLLPRIESASTYQIDTVVDPVFYFNMNADVREVFGPNMQTAFDMHWLKGGQAQGRRGSRQFDVKFYLNLYADLRAAFGTDYVAASNHWATSGLAAGRRGSREFDVKFYLDQYPDLKAAFGTYYAAALNHWVTYGLAEGRRGSREFDVKFYLNKYPDLSAEFGTNYHAALDHWITTGIQEGRQGSSDFDVQSYLAQNMDLGLLFGTNYQSAIDHWILHGAETAERWWRVIAKNSGKCMAVDGANPALYP